jgi:hypothetical protein
MYPKIQIFEYSSVTQFIPAISELRATTRRRCPISMIKKAVRAVFSGPLRNLIVERDMDDI